MAKPRMLAAVFSLIVLAGQIPVGAQSAVDSDINKKIRQEETDHSQIMHTMHYLTDIYGPRLTGSPNHKAAADWAIGEMKAWGFENAHLEPWDFGHPGWSNERATGYIISAYPRSTDIQSLGLDAEHQRHAEGTGRSDRSS
jgi:carboxypeptidase Q